MSGFAVLAAAIFLGSTVQPLDGSPSDPYVGLWRLQEGMHTTLAIERSSLYWTIPGNGNETRIYADYLMSDDGVVAGKITEIAVQLEDGTINLKFSPNSPFGCTFQMVEDQLVIGNFHADTGTGPSLVEGCYSRNR